jgi:TonB family protein
MYRALASLVPFLTLSVSSVLAHPDAFHDSVANAARLSTLTEPGAKPFHLKLASTDTTLHNPRYSAQIELWWAGPEKWRREVKSPDFTQTAIQNGTAYSETNSSDYLPRWLQELVQESVDPVSHVALENVEARADRPGCGSWEQFYSRATDKISFHSSVCFNVDGTLRDIFVEPLGVEFGDYRVFAGKTVPRTLTVWPGGSASDAKATVSVLEALKTDDSIFTVAQDTGFGSRLRFESVEESALAPEPSNSQPTWPVLHNFPESGIIAINITLDRTGAVREVGTALSRNVAVEHPAIDQIRKWKFQPVLHDGAPVQVTTVLTLHFESKMELAGANGANVPAKPFRERIEKSRAATDPRTEGAPPFHLQATIQFDAAHGSYEETWLTPLKWRREIHLGSVSALQARNSDRIYTQRKGDDFALRPVDFTLDLIDGHLPFTGSGFREGDWGQSAVEISGVPLVRVARGEVDDQNRPKTGQAFWFDADDTLLADFVQPFTTTYSQFQPWGAKQVPRHFQSMFQGKPLFLNVESIESPANVDDSQFALANVQPEVLGGPDFDKSVPEVVFPKPIHQVRPQGVRGPGTVTVQVAIDKHGHVIDAKVTKSTSGRTQEDAALQAALLWEYSPLRIKGHPTRSTATIDFAF